MFKDLRRRKVNDGNNQKACRIDRVQRTARSVSEEKNIQWKGEVVFGRSVREKGMFERADRNVGHPMPSVFEYEGQHKRGLRWNILIPVISIF